MVIELQDIVITYLATELREQVSDFACALTQRGVIGVVHVAKRKIPLNRPPQIQPKTLSKIEQIVKEGEESIENYLSKVKVDQFILDFQELIDLSQKEVLKEKIIELVKNLD